MDALNQSGPDLQIAVGPLHLSNPVMTASGTFGYAVEFAQLAPLSQLPSAFLPATPLDKLKSTIKLSEEIGVLS